MDDVLAFESKEDAIRPDGCECGLWDIFDAAKRCEFAVECQIADPSNGREKETLSDPFAAVVMD